jgi:hypothetical protein
MLEEHTKPKKVNDWTTRVPAKKNYQSTETTAAAAVLTSAFKILNLTKQDKYLPWYMWLMPKGLFSNDICGCSGLRLLSWHSVGGNGAVSDGLPSALLPSGGGGVALGCVRLFVVLVYASACYIQCFFFLYDRAVLLLSFKKNPTSSN